MDEREIVEAVLSRSRAPLGIHDGNERWLSQCVICGGKNAHQDECPIPDLASAFDFDDPLEW